MMKNVEKQLNRLFVNLLSNDIWIYECYFFFYAYFLMQNTHNLGWSFYLGSILALNLLFFSPLVFAFFGSKLARSNKPSRYWLLWLLSFVLIPMSVFYVLPSTETNQPLTMSQSFSSDYFFNTNIFFLDSAISLIIIYWITHVSKLQNRSGKVAKWLRSISFFKLSIIVIGLVALLLPLISTNFQKISGDLTTMNLIWEYIKAVPQIFIIYFSHYIFFSINHNYLFKLIFERKGIVAYIISLIGLILILTPILNSFFLLFPVVNNLQIHPLGTGINLFDDINYIFSVTIVLVSFPIIVLIEWNRKSIAIKELESQKANAELSLLKQQINPHFFFNTLNNLYSLSLDKSDEAPSTILKLSKLMRFVIYKGQEDKVSLAEEVDYIKDYIDLQKIRLKQNVDIQFHHDLENPSLQIPPLLFIILVENAFKHGINPSEKDGFIHIVLETQENTLIFKCENSIDKDGTSFSEKGIGIENLRKRLDIHFSGRYELKIVESDMKYLTKLTLDL